jgi:hypothetical protein
MAFKLIWSRRKRKIGLLLPARVSLADDRAMADDNQSMAANGQVVTAHFDH